MTYGDNNIFMPDCFGEYAVDVLGYSESDVQTDDDCYRIWDSISDDQQREAIQYCH